MSSRVVITGASSEIGLAICKELITDTDEVILQYHQNPSVLDALLRSTKARIQTRCVDFRNNHDLDAFCSDLGDVDILINGAALTKADLLVNLTDEVIQYMIQINIIAVVRLCRAVIPAMVARRRGSIVNISSVSAQRANRGQTVYAGSKGFIESFTRAMASEYGSKGVRINAVAPGPIASGSLRELLSYAREEVEQSTITGRLGKPEDVAAMVAYLCSEKASFINGKIFSIDGGFQRGV